MSNQIEVVVFSGKLVSVLVRHKTKTEAFSQVLEIIFRRKIFPVFMVRDVGKFFHLYFQKELVKFERISVIQTCTRHKNIRTKDIKELLSNIKQPASQILFVSNIKNDYRAVKKFGVNFLLVGNYPDKPKIGFSVIKNILDLPKFLDISG